MVGFVSVAAWVSTTTSLISVALIAILILIAALVRNRYLESEGSRPWFSLVWAIVAGLLTIALYALFGPAGGDDGFRFLGYLISYDAIRLGGLMALRLLALLTLSYLLLISVAPLELAAGLTRFMMPLRRVSVAVANLYYLTFFLSRMIPSLLQESRVIALAQRSRGIGARRGMYGRWREYPARVLPIFASALRRSDSMALLFASRGFNAGHVPLRVTKLRFAPSDILVLGVLCSGWAVWFYLRLGGS
jgi:energy-coupling factor transport system permease protein